MTVKKRSKEKQDPSKKKVKYEELTLGTSPNTGSTCACQCMGIQAT